jgi:hypothetical protein
MSLFDVWSLLVARLKEAVLIRSLLASTAFLVLVVSLDDGSVEIHGYLFGHHDKLILVLEVVFVRFIVQ